MKSAEPPHQEVFESERKLCTPAVVELGPDEAVATAEQCSAANCGEVKMLDVKLVSKRC